MVIPCPRWRVCPCRSIRTTGATSRQRKRRHVVGSRGRWGRKRTQALMVTHEGLAVMGQIEVKTHAPYTLPPQPADDLPYKGYLVVGTRWDGAKTPYYPLFPQDRAWPLVSRDGASLDNPDHAVHDQHRFGMDQPTLAW